MVLPSIPAIMGLPGGSFVRTGIHGVDHFRDLADFRPRVAASPSDCERRVVVQMTRDPSKHSANIDRF